MNDISKSDWKLFQERVPEWQEHYMERLIKEYVELLTSPGKASERFWKLEKRIKQDKKYQESRCNYRSLQLFGTA